MADQNGNPIFYAPYMGQVMVSEPGADRGVTLLFTKYEYPGSCNVNTLYTASSAPYGIAMPGLTPPGVIQVWCPWCDDLDTALGSISLQIGQTVAVQCDIWTGVVSCYSPQAIVSGVNVIVDNTQRMPPFLYLAFTSVWVYQAGGGNIRDIGGDNDAGDAGFDTGD